MRKKKLGNEKVITMKNSSKLLATVAVLLIFIMSALQCSAAGNVAMPDTGGIGTTIFIIGGAALMLIAVVFLIVSKYRDR